MAASNGQYRLVINCVAVLRCLPTSLCTGISLNYGSRAPAPSYNYVSPPPLIPAARPAKSCLHTIPGRPYGALEQAIGQHSLNHPVLSPAEHRNLQDAYDTVVKKLGTALAEVEEKNTELEQKAGKVVELEEKLRRQQMEICEASEEITNLTAHISDLHMERRVRNLISIHTWHNHLTCNSTRFLTLYCLPSLYRRALSFLDHQYRLHKCPAAARLVQLHGRTLLILVPRSLPRSAPWKESNLRKHFRRPKLLATSM